MITYPRCIHCGVLLRQAFEFEYRYCELSASKMHSFTEADPTFDPADPFHPSDPSLKGNTTTMAIRKIAEFPPPGPLPAVHPETRAAAGELVRLMHATAGTSAEPVIRDIGLARLRTLSRLRDNETPPALDDNELAKWFAFARRSQ